MLPSSYILYFTSTCLLVLSSSSCYVTSTLRQCLHCLYLPILWLLSVSPCFSSSKTFNEICSVGKPLLVTILACALISLSLPRFSLQNQLHISLFSVSSWNPQLCGSLRCSSFRECELFGLIPCLTSAASCPTT